LASAQQPTPTAKIEPAAKTSVQIVNATSVPSISLEVNGRLNYPDFPQGKFTANEPIQGLAFNYKIVNKANGSAIYPDAIKYNNRENHTLLLIGDFSMVEEGDGMTQLIEKDQESEVSKKMVPNLGMRVYSHQQDLLKKPICVRIINGMPGKMLRFRSPVTNSDVILNSGDEIQLEGQPNVQIYHFLVDATPFKVPINQDENPINANIIFYLENKHAKFMRFYQSIDEPEKFDEN
jgi:hypothetical protein